MRRPGCGPEARHARPPRPEMHGSTRLPPRRTQRAARAARRARRRPPTTRGDAVVIRLASARTKRNTCLSRTRTSCSTRQAGAPIEKSWCVDTISGEPLRMPLGNRLMLRSTRTARCTRWTRTWTRRRRDASSARDCRSRGAAIFTCLFVNTFGSPPEDSWGGRDGVAALIRHRLDIPSDSYRMVFRALEDIAACEKANTVYDPSGDAAFSGRKALVSRFLSRGGGFCPPRVIARGQVVIRTPHWRNKRGAAYTSFVLLFFRWKFLPFAPRRRPKRADFFPRARPHGKQSRNTRAWPVHRPKQDPRVRTSKMDRPKATARPIRSACRLSQCGPISDNSDSGPI